jgi:tryptophan synthase alpha chain
VSKLLIPYVTGGVTEDWTDHLLAFQDAGADAIEVGLPFSDPMLDGVTIQRASDQALARGVTVASILADLQRVRDRVRVPLIAFTYANLVFRHGPAAFCRLLAGSGIDGLIVPDLPVDEAQGVRAAATDAGVDLTLLAAPVTPDDRLAKIATQSSRFVYAISRMGTTGERPAPASKGTTPAGDLETLTDTAGRLVARVKAYTGLPVVIGFGISGPDQAAAAGRAGDGVAVGSALMRRVLDGATPDDLRHQVAALRAALDQEVSADRAAYAEVSGDRP